MSLGERVVSLMMIFAIFGATSGAIIGAMEAQGTNWFPGASAPPVENYEILNSSDINSISGSNEGVIGETTSFFSYSLGSIKLIIGAAYRIVYIKDILGDIFFISSTENPTVNLFSPFLTIIQVMIWLCYGVFIVELKTKFKFS